MVDSSSMAPLMHQLPAEIRQHILRDSCKLSTLFCVALCSLSSWTRSLALPYLYTTVVIQKHREASSLLSALLQPSLPFTESTFHPGSHIQNLWIISISNLVIKILARCRMINNLALASENFNWLIHSSTARPASVLTTNIRKILLERPHDYQVLITAVKRPDWASPILHPNDPARSPLFDAITHLRIGYIGSYYATYLELAHFKRLSHLAVPYHKSDLHYLPDLLKIFDFPATMCLVVVILEDQLSTEAQESALDWIVDTRKSNTRVYVLKSRLLNLQQEWEAEARGGLDVWERAERFTMEMCR